MARISEIYKERHVIPGNFVPITHDPTLGQTEAFRHLLGRAPAMQELYRSVCLVAPTDATVFIIGDSGTGKEITARLIHDLSMRNESVFLAVNCGALSPQLVESELFGHQKGSFTGAMRDHKGFFECAQGGTLFLDEITEMSMDLQVKLLRVLETQQVMRVGSGREIATDVRIIAATNRTPLTAVKEGKLREDLFYRLQVFPIEIPRLSERVEDIELLANRFLDELNASFNSDVMFSDAAIEAMNNYDWPGNVRELKNVVHRSFILSECFITDAHIPKPQTFSPDLSSRGSTLTLSIGCSLADAEKTIILATLDKFNSDKERTARVLGISLKTLYNRLNQYMLTSAKAAEC